jgi:hypothetical protein
MPLAVRAMQQRGGIVQVERIVFVLIDEPQRGIDRPFRVVSFERRLHVLPVNVFDLREATLPNQLAGSPLIVPFHLFDPVGVDGTFRDGFPIEVSSILLVDMRPHVVALTILENDDVRYIDTLRYLPKLRRVAVSSTVLIPELSAFQSVKRLRHLSFYESPVTILV